MNKNNIKYILLGGGLIAIFALAALLLKLLGGNADPSSDSGPLVTRRPDTTVTTAAPSTTLDSVTVAPPETTKTNDAAGSETAGAKTEASDSEYQAPDFTLSNNLGETHSLSEFRGRIIVLNFWASWCPPCRAEMPMLDAWYKEIKDRDDIVFIAVDLTDGGRETRDAADRFIAGEGYSFPYYYDERQAGTPSAAELYYVQSIPTTWIIAPDFNLFYQHRGILTRDQLDHFLESVKSYAAEAN
ncbi:MAG: TlpA disulfide reductase family protein [Bacillota bacterium]|nr:TlpA disulfide reductase family protein [Bacillota bacterium]